MLSLIAKINQEIVAQLLNGQSLTLGRLFPCPLSKSIRINQTMLRNINTLKTLTNDK
jgi:hypothetical protein